MKFKFYRETLSLYIELRQRDAIDVKILADGIVADIDRSGQAVGLDIDCAEIHSKLLVIIAKFSRLVGIQK